MARCQQCKTNNHEVLYPYGGMLLCFYCNERHNPVTETVYALSPEHRKRLEDKKIELESQIKKIEYELRVDDKVKESNGVINFIKPRKYHV